MKTTKQQPECFLHKDLVLSTLLIKQIKLLPKDSPKKRSCETALPKSRSPKPKRDESSILSPQMSLDNSILKLQESSMCKLEEDSNMECLSKLGDQKPNIILSPEKETPPEDDKPLLPEEHRPPQRPKKKKVFGSVDSMVETFNHHKLKENKEDEEEIYGKALEADDYTIDDMEKRMNEWLDSNNILVKDPMEKKDEFYQKKKNLVMKSAHNSPVKEMEVVDCNSPALNLSVNSGLLMKRKMKSTTVCLENKPLSISKFSQN